MGVVEFVLLIFTQAGLATPLAIPMASAQHCEIAKEQIAKTISARGWRAQTYICVQIAGQLAEEKP